MVGSETLACSLQGSLPAQRICVARYYSTVLEQCCGNNHLCYNVGIIVSCPNLSTNP